MTPQFVNDNYELLKEAFSDWLNDAKKNAQYGSGIFGGGDIRELEGIFCKSFHSKYSLAVSSGTAGLHTALVALGLSKDSTVIILGSNWVGLSSLVSVCGAIPVFVERKNIFSFLKRGEWKTKNKTILIYVRSKNDEDHFKKVHKECEKNEIPIIEDWSALKEINLEKNTAPLYGDFAVFSFGYDKWIQAGEGGMVLINRQDYFEKIICFSQHPISQKAHGIFNTNRIAAGLNYRIHPLAARLALVQIRKLLEDKNIKTDVGTRYENIASI